MWSTSLAALRSLFVISDEQAMQRVQASDDERSFAELMSRWEGPIQRLCVRMTGDAHEGQDLAQETFVRVFVRRREYQPNGKFSTWLWRIALNLCYDELRRRRRHAESSLDELGNQTAARLEEFLAAEPAPDESAAEQESRRLVRGALLRLPETYRAVVVLRHYEGLKFREIAEVLGVPEGTAKSRMAEGLTQLGHLLRPMLEAPKDLKKQDQPKESLVI
jgi:RNA polymerase sigma-70 factor (ECF subfamily)